MAAERGGGFSGQVWAGVGRCGQVWEGSELEEPVGRKTVSEAKESVEIVGGFTEKQWVDSGRWFERLKEGWCRRIIE